MQQDEPTHGAWLSWRLAVEYVERRHGWGWGEAAKAVDGACAQGKLICKQGRDDGPDVWDVGFWRWLDNPQSKDRATPKRDIAKLAIKELWPNGIPKELSNKQIEKKAGDWITDYCKRSNLKCDMSRDTLLRAAGRKK